MGLEQQSWPHQLTSPSWRGTLTMPAPTSGPRRQRPPLETSRSGAAGLEAPRCALPSGAPLLQSIPGSLVCNRPASRHAQGGAANSPPTPARRRIVEGETNHRACGPLQAATRSARCGAKELDLRWPATGCQPPREQRQARRRSGISGSAVRFHRAVVQ